MVHPVLLEQQEVEEYPNPEMCTCSHIQNVKEALPYERATVSGRWKWLTHHHSHPQTENAISVVCKEIINAS